MSYILSLNIGNTNIKAILIDDKGNLIVTEQKNIPYQHPFIGQIEQNPEILFETTLSVVNKIIDRNTIQRSSILGIGISNEKKTTILWNKKTGKPLWNAILGTDSRTENICKKLLSHNSKIKEKTGLELSSFESATKIQWILKKTEVKNTEDICFGNLNTWISWKLSGGTIFATDSINASSTLLFNIHTNSWDEQLLNIFEIEEKILPEVKSCQEIYGYTDKRIFGA